jgi:hypothetical protein
MKQTYRDKDIPDTNLPGKETPRGSKLEMLSGLTGSSK